MQRLVGPLSASFSSVAGRLQRFTKIHSLRSGHVPLLLERRRHILSFRHIAMLTHVYSKKKPALILRGRLVRPRTTEPV